MRVALLSREFPPHVYGGAGVHVEYLARELARLVELTVHHFGPDGPTDGPTGGPGDGPGARPGVVGHEPWERLAGRHPYTPALEAMSVDLAMAAASAGADLVHSHTWYANLGGHLAKLVHGIPHVATVHSLEPQRPWKAEQLGGGYALSSFCERTGLEGADAVVAVSDAVAHDVRRCYPDIDPARVHVIHNGVDPDDYRPEHDTRVLERYGIDPERPVVLFVGRITRQKGIEHLLHAAPFLARGVQLVLRAGSPDTEQIAAEVAQGVADARAAGHEVVLVQDNLAREELIHLIGAATVFCCPSVYEPFGLVNVEAMACGVPVVASAVGGIPEVVDDGVTGLLVPVELVHEGTGTPEPRVPAEFARNLAAALNQLVTDPALARKYGEAGRQRVVERFSWRGVAERTVALYQALTG
ncbi:MAG TPA: glycogen synthase [Acidimicrobiales bacterium]|nr:glycogen synthase [Acidimicrobiales bacterium]